MTSRTDVIAGGEAIALRSGRLRRATVVALVVAATVAALASVVAVWAQRQLLDTNVYVGTSSAMLADPTIRTAVATYAVDEVYRRVNVEAELKDVLPTNVNRFSNLAAAALRPAAYQLVDRALQTSLLASLWEQANRQAHEQFVHTVVGGGGNVVSTTGGVVTLDLRPILVEATQRIGLGASLAARIPADAGSIEVLRSGQLATAQDALRLLDTVAKFLPFVALGLYAAAVWLARDRRREALRDSGTGLVVGGGLTLLLVGPVGGVVLDHVVSQPQAHDAAAAAWRIVESPLQGALWTIIALGAVVVTGAALAGPGTRPKALRRSLAPYLEWRGFAIGAGLAVVVLLLLTGTIDSFVRFAWLTIFATLAGFGIEVLRRQTTREFPNADRSALANWLRARWEILSDRGRTAAETARARYEEHTARSPATDTTTIAAGSEPTTPAPAHPSPLPPSHDDLDRLERLADLHDRGVLTDEEFETMKARLVRL